jgi:hypothetical protein
MLYPTEFCDLSVHGRGGGSFLQKTDKSQYFIRSCVLLGEEDLTAIEELVEDSCGGFPKAHGKPLTFHAMDVFSRAWGMGGSGSEDSP